MVHRSIKKIVAVLKKKLKEEGFPECEVYLFGSYARGEASKDSDIDLCLVSDSFKKNKKKYEKIAVYIAFRVDYRIQIVLADKYKFYKDPLSPLFSSVRREAIAA